MPPPATVAPTVHPALQNLLSANKRQVIPDLLNQNEIKTATDTMLQDVEGTLRVREEANRRKSSYGLNADQNNISVVAEKITQFYDTMNQLSVSKGTGALGTSMQNLGRSRSIFNMAQGNFKVGGNILGSKRNLGSKQSLGSKHNLQRKNTFGSKNTLGSQILSAPSNLDTAEGLAEQIRRIEETLQKYNTKASSLSLNKRGNVPVISVEESFGPEIRVVVDEPATAPAPTFTVDAPQKMDPVTIVIDGGENVNSTKNTFTEQTEQGTDPVGEPHYPTAEVSNSIPIAPDIQGNQLLADIVQNRRRPSFDFNSIDKRALASRRASLAMAMGGIQVPLIPTLHTTTTEEVREDMEENRITEDTQEEKQELNTFDITNQPATQSSEPTPSDAYVPQAEPNLQDLKHFIKGRRKRQGALRQQLLEAFQTRLDTEVPRAMFISLLKDSYPILKATLDRYKSDLGDKHPFTIHFREHIQQFEQVLTAVDDKIDMKENRRVSLFSNHSHDNARPLSSGTAETFGSRPFSPMSMTSVISSDSRHKTRSRLAVPEISSGPPSAQGSSLHIREGADDSMAHNASENANLSTGGDFMRVEMVKKSQSDMITQMLTSSSTRASRVTISGSSMNVENANNSVASDATRSTVAVKLEPVTTLKAEQPPVRMTTFAVPSPPVPTIAVDREDPAKQ